MVMFSRSALLALPKSNSLELQSLTRHPGSTASTTTYTAARSDMSIVQNPTYVLTAADLLTGIL